MRRPSPFFAIALLFLAPRALLAQGFAPSEAASRMTIADGLEVRLFASEPMVRQPVAIEFDDRGRLWVIQYLQYPNPAGLKRVEVDRYSRTVYDRIPDPPPKGPRGADRITILEDTDGDGRADRARDFIDGLNLASGLAFGYGGVFVLQTPYLLFYADRDHDDRPDGDPEVLLTGFGMEDAHSVANSLTWGPDGWLYGLQGSTVSANIRGIAFQQGVWRYHPVSHRFELFCEGGGNMWGLDFDKHGQLFACTNVGGFVMLHGNQGAYYWKSFGKHGPLHNPYTFGYFDHVAHNGVQGGHVAVGGLFYQADTLPKEWRGRFIAGDLLGHAVHWHEVTPVGSTFTAKQKGDILRANDTWFAPTDMTLGPDGALYLSDWHDKRTAHPDPDADWDRTNGRIYRIATPGFKAAAPLDFTRMNGAELIARLDDPNVAIRRRAWRRLAENHSQDDIVSLRQRLDSLEALWALHGCGGLDDELALQLLNHPSADFRDWTVRLLGDRPALDPRLAARLAALAESEPSPVVRAQLACTAQRLSPTLGLEVAQRLALRDLDRDDPHIPLLLWWAVERHAMAAVDGTLERFATPVAWQSALVRSVILGRLMRRFASDGSSEGDSAAARLLATAPEPDGGSGRMLLAALDEALRGRSAESIAPGLAQAVSALLPQSPAPSLLIRLAARVGNRDGLARARTLASQGNASEMDRVSMIELLAELKDPASLGVLRKLATDGETDAIQAAALKALASLGDDSTAAALLATYSTQGPAWRSRARSLFLSRASWAREYLSAIDRGKLPASELTIDQLAIVATHHSAELDALVRKHWGQLRGASPGEKLAEVRRLNNDLRAAPGNPEQGHQQFQKHCVACHRLFGEGNTIGPELTHANRQDRDFLLVSLVDPSVVVRKEYQAFIVHTHDGRVMTGQITEQTPETIAIRDAKGETIRVPRKDVEEIQESAASLMPEALYKELNPEQLRDLFSYLQGPGPSAPRSTP